MAEREQSRIRLKSKCKEEMLEANINPETFEILCPDCSKGNFKIFRRDNLSEGQYLNHCKCENCGQIFVYKVDKENNIILEKGTGESEDVDERGTK